MAQQHQLVAVEDFERWAHSVLPRKALDYYRSGANCERTLRDNVAAFSDWLLLPRMLVGVTNRSLATSLLGQPVSAPIGVAPTAMQRLASDRGELDTAEAAAEAGVCLTVSTIATCSLESVAKANGAGLRWFQLYVYKDRELTRRVVQRAERAGYRALVLTVDAPVFGQRYADSRNGFGLPGHLRLANFEADGGSQVADGMGESATDGGVSALTKYSGQLFDPGLTWQDVRWLTEISSLPVVVKGVVRPEDAVLAADAGAAAVWVSNHGARQLDTVPAAVDTLPAVAAALAGRPIEIYLDGGVRTGTDVLKALALGARAVFLGRPVLWGLAHSGRAGVRRVLDIVTQELDLALALSGETCVGSVRRDLVEHRARFRGKL